MSVEQSLKDNYKGAWGSRIGFGSSSALLVIDFMKGYTEPTSPLYAEGVVSAVVQAGEFLAAVRALKIPVIHTNIIYSAPDCVDGGVWVKKSPVMKLMVKENPLTEFCPEVQPATSEQIITKQYASAFFGTSLAAQLHSMGVDTIMLTGCSTSGCIRATAVDGVQHGFRVIVIGDCVGDRHDAPHQANLFDIDSKYGDVVAYQDALKVLREKVLSA
ncbi:N-carbamoylsarcosine amidohydrolase [Pseudomonas profundi]|uniref:N-carbamoylsarcosine amidohydrolase n=1 Tax=Pseudomonas profundi TaxID=1981513 RepID=UPI00123A14A3|nr:N-carbamoylsarcosine amidohydrolase [Pseudomonas profundi]